MLAITFYDGEYDNISFFTRICELEGSAVPFDRPPFSLLEEAARVLEMCTDKYSTPLPAGEHVPVFVGRKTGTEDKPLARLDIRITGGQARASIESKDAPRVDTEPVAVDSDDDVATIARKVLSIYSRAS
ncbi:hypothetical protein [Paraburkholderia elongata]|uniref:Uncharacterized protein n=1 Tax=Paraburkholderia elongata TaxID=2675747 RepID=A0A972NUZ6_9BURK|nr:hypothetical protein [Paraburkholderia elongata]NPT58115.1 hypothetical protein [Paraburkholderia elongata]